MPSAAVLITTHGPSSEPALDPPAEDYYNEQHIAVQPTTPLSDDELHAWLITTEDGRCVELSNSVSEREHGHFTMLEPTAEQIAALKRVVAFLEGKAT